MDVGYQPHILLFLFSAGYTITRQNKTNFNSYRIGLLAFGRNHQELPLLLKGFINEVHLRDKYNYFQM